MRNTKLVASLGMPECSKSNYKTILEGMKRHFEHTIIFLKRYSPTGLKEEVSRESQREEVAVTTKVNTAQISMKEVLGEIPSSARHRCLET